MISTLAFTALVWGSLALVLLVFGYLLATVAGVDPVGRLVARR